MEKNTVYVEISGGIVTDVYGDPAVKVVILDRDTQDDEELERVEAKIEELEKNKQSISFYGV